MNIYHNFLEEVRKTRRQSTYKRILDIFPTGTEDEIVDYLDQSSHSDVTKKNNLRILNTALKYNGTLTKGIHRIISTFTPDEPIQECPTDEQVELVWSNLPSDRNRAIFALMAYMGLRVGEVHGLNLADIMPMVHERVEISLANYISAERKKSPTDALFTSIHGRLSLPYIQEIIKTEFTVNGLGKYHCHSLRRYFANSMYNNNVSLLDMQDCMRHASAEPPPPLPQSEPAEPHRCNEESLLRQHRKEICMMLHTPAFMRNVLECQNRWTTKDLHRMATTYKLGTKEGESPLDILEFPSK